MNNAEDEEKENFYSSLQAAVEKISQLHLLMCKGSQCKSRLRKCWTRKNYGSTWMWDYTVND